MDKSANQKGITIKINGQEKSFEETKADRFIPENQVAASAEKADEESFDWILPDEDDFSLNEIKTTASKTKGKAAIYTFGGNQKNNGRNGSAVKAPIIAIICAILLGTLIGFIILKTITSNGGTIGQKENPATSTVPAPQSAAGPAEKNEKTITSPLTVYLVQGGVFKTEDSAAQIQKSIEQKGIPAEIFKLDGKFYIFSGTAGSLEDSKQLAIFYKQKQIAVFWKEVSFSASIKGRDKAFINDLSALYSLLAKSTSGLQFSSESSIDQKQLEKQVATVNKTAKGVSTEPLISMKRRLSTAAELLGNYQTSKDQEKLLLAQEQLLAFLKAYQRLESE